MFPQVVVTLAVAVSLPSATALWPRSCYSLGWGYASLSFGPVPHLPAEGEAEVDALEVTETGEGASPVDTGLSQGHKVWAGGPGPSCCLNKDSGIKLLLVLGFPGVVGKRRGGRLKSETQKYLGSVRQRVSNL